MKAEGEAFSRSAFPRRCSPRGAALANLQPQALPRELRKYPRMTPVPVACRLRVVPAHPAVQEMALLRAGHSAVSVLQRAMPVWYSGWMSRKATVPLRTAEPAAA